ncbi:uncharacterized protein LOC110855680 [Folsomia candida]|uniref:EGF-like domain-containing protein n=1 Tax=Folsomia candida TaxID=158441 RepID=A0A226DPR8_FOLCA|nr:uncharacterized protein LOC110855680 [Folsomia candida]OXA47505.1 hypothetical protein Fcan01_17745 [Folsomia candida]
MSNIPRLFLILGALMVSCKSQATYCNWPQVMGPDSVCYSGANGACETTAECMPGDQLICDGGRCKCRNPVNMWYNSNDNTCTIKLGLPCIPDHATDKCGDKTVCLEDSSLASNTGYSCQCDAGFIMGTDGSYCHKGHLESCAPYECGSEMMTAGGRGLACIKGQCQCKNTPAQTWDDAKQLCGGLEGTECTFNSVNHLECHTGLTCVKQGQTADGICRNVPATTTAAPATTTTAALTTKPAATTRAATTKRPIGK